MAKIANLENHLKWFVVMIVVVLIATFSAFSQTLNSGVPATVQPGDARYAEWKFKELYALRKSANTNEIAWEQVRRDFLQLQIANNKLFDLTEIIDNVDDTKLTVLVRSIKKRAIALDEKLPLPETNVTISLKGVESQPIRGSLKMLDATTLRFARNEVFKQLNVIDVDKSESAAHDLQMIIALCESIEKRLKTNHIASK